MMTRSAGRATAAPRGGRTGGRTGRGGGRTRGRSGDQGNGRIDGQGSQVGGQGIKVNDGVDGVPDFSTIINNDHRGCTYKDFLACNLKEYDGKGGAIVYTRWIEKMESVQDMSGCRDSHKVKYTAGSFVGKALTWWNSQIHTRGREATVGSMSWLVPRDGGSNGANDHSKGCVQIFGTLTDEAIRTRTRNAFATTTNHVRRENTGMTPKCTTCNFHHPPEIPCHTCFNCNRPRHFAKDCRVVPRSVNPINSRNPTARTCYECGSTDHFKAACPRLNQAQKLGETIKTKSWMLTGVRVVGTTVTRHATTLFDSGADYSFISTTFIPLLGIKPSDLGFSYEIEIASRQLVEINKVIMGCKLEVEGHEFDINLIPFGSGSFDVIIKMDWLSNHKAEIICHEKVIRIPLPDGKVLRVLGERPKEKMRYLVSAKAKEHKQEELVVVRDFPEVFLDDLSGLPYSREIEFRIELVPEAIPVAKSPYRLAPSEMEEFSGQLKEL
ncbi:putative reverse transcriptase domain-containing protein [Tanacetum coccineum]